MFLKFQEAEKILKKYNIPLVKYYLVKNIKEAVKKAEFLKYPVVLKIDSSKILHRTEVKGVRKDIYNQEELKKIFNQLSKIKNSEGILIQKQIQGIQVILGGKRDPVFGPLVLFGLGGIFVETFKDISFRLAPLGRKDAKEMIKEIRGYEILKGYREQKSIDFKKLESLLISLSSLIINEKIKEIDLNPVIINGKENFVVDAKIIL